MVPHTLKGGLGALGLKELHLLSRTFAELGLRKAKEKGEEAARTAHKPQGGTEEHRGWVGNLAWLGMGMRRGGGMHHRQIQTDEQPPCQSLPRMGNKRRKPGRWSAEWAPDYGSLTAGRGGTEQPWHLDWRCGMATGTSAVGETRKAGKEGAWQSQRELRLGGRRLKRRRAVGGAEPSWFSRPSVGRLTSPGSRPPAR